MRQCSIVPITLLSYLSGNGYVMFGTSAQVVKKMVLDFDITLYYSSLIMLEYDSIVLSDNLVGDGVGFIVKC